MGECILQFGKSGSGGIGKTMVVSRTHEGNEASIFSPLEVEYYQNLAQGDLFNSIILKKGNTPVPAERSIVDSDKIQLNGFLLEESTKYDFEVPVGAVKDKLGNVLKGVYRYSFTTGLAPYFIVTPEATKAAFDTVVASINRDGGTIYFTEGEFRGLFPIKITHSDVTLQGEGTNTKIICDTPDSGAQVGVIGVEGTSAVYITNFTISDMVIDGNYSRDIVDHRYHGLELKYVDLSAVKNLVLQNIGVYGILLQASKNNTITGNISQNNAIYGIYLADSSNNTVTGNTSQNNDSYGIYLTDSSNNTVTGNTSQNNSGSGIQLGISNNNTITGNTLQNNSSTGFFLLKSSNNTITGNTVQNNTQVGIQTYNASSNNTISGNIIQYNGHGIVISGATDVSNIILANKYQSISNSGTNTIISQNIEQP